MSPTARTNARCSIFGKPPHPRRRRCCSSFMGAVGWEATSRISTFLAASGNSSRRNLRCRDNYPYIVQTILVDETIPLLVITAAKVATEDPPVMAVFHNNARALQFVRSKAAEWNIDKARIAVSGGSAGACSACGWPFTRTWPTREHRPRRARVHPPVVRRGDERADHARSAAMKEWTPNNSYGGHAFGFAWTQRMARPSSGRVLRGGRLCCRGFKNVRLTRLPPAALLRSIFGMTTMRPPTAGEKRPQSHGKLRALLEEKLRRIGVECELVYPGAPR